MYNNVFLIIVVLMIGAITLMFKNV